MCNACLAAGASRRLFVRAGAGAGSAPFFGTAQAQLARAADTPDKALNLLLEGNGRYVANQMRGVTFASRAARTQGQAPFAAILGCAVHGSRRNWPSTRAGRPVRGARRRQLHDARWAGQPEYGAAVLGTKAIMVLGHTNCGAVNATVAALQSATTCPVISPTGAGDEARIEPVLKQPAPIWLSARWSRIARERAPAEAKPLLAEMVAGGKLRVVGAVYDLATGKVAMVGSRGRRPRLPGIRVPGMAGAGERHRLGERGLYQHIHIQDVAVAVHVPVREILGGIANGAQDVLAVRRRRRSLRTFLHPHLVGELEEARSISRSG